MSRPPFPRPFQFRPLPWVVLFILFFGLNFVGRLVELATDWFWFDELGYRSIFLTVLFSKLRLGFLAGIVGGIVIGANLWIAWRAGKEALVLQTEDDVVQLPFKKIQENLLKWVLPVAALLLAYWIGSWASTRWETVLKFYNASSFGVTDPLFEKDVAFYVFSLPFYRFIASWVTVILVLSLLGAAAVRLLQGQIVFDPRGFRITSPARAHLLVLGGLLCLLVAFRIHLSVFELPMLQRSIAPGAGYSDVHAYLPGLKTMRILAALAALLLWAAVWIRGNRLPLAAAGLIVIGFIAVRGYREFVQRFEVAPNEIVKETRFIRWGIDGTRFAYGISTVQEMEFDPASALSATALKRNDATIQNIRLWDHQPLLTTFSQLQEIRTYYEFLDVDNDRYRINNDYRQVMLSPREIVSSSLPSRIWINEHLTYTHGYGLCLGPVNRITPEGLPEFFIKDIPPVSSVDLKVTRPEIYYGESPNSYAIARTKSKEFDYPSGEENVYSEYEGRGGVPIRNLVRQLLFSIRFKEIKIVLSQDIKPDSRILMYRNIRERVNRVAPFLFYDHDPYMIVSDSGRLLWMIDAYTVTSRFPYSESVRGIGNYIRNSVKVTVDAYDGNMNFYVTDAADPLIRVYEAIFPDLFHPLADMPGDIREHIRYPQSLLAIQSSVYSTYHMTDPQVFYNKEDLWKVPVQPDGRPMEPYYTIMKLAGVGAKEEFILMVPFTPAKKENMIAWMAARCDGENYGKVLVYNFPKQKLVYGPSQINSRIDQDAEISKQLSLWNQGGSRVIRGSLLVIPVDQSLLYVQPLYLASEGGGLPEAKRVIVAYGNSIAMEPTLEDSLAQIFGRSIGRLETPSIRPSARVEPRLSSPDQVRKAREHFRRAQEKLRAGDWAAYGEEIRALGDLLDRMTGRD